MSSGMTELSMTLLFKLWVCNMHSHLPAQQQHSCMYVGSAEKMQSIQDGMMGEKSEMNEDASDKERRVDVEASDKEGDTVLVEKDDNAAEVSTNTHASVLTLSNAHSTDCASYNNLYV